MLWSDIRRMYLESVAALEPLVADIEDPEAPALGVWNVRGLTGHLLRALRTPVQYLAEPEPAADQILDAAGYYRAYLAWRATDPTTSDDAVATRGTFELQGATVHDIAEAYREAAWDVGHALSRVDGSRIVATPTGALRIDEYLRTRLVEVIVHGMDLARATSREWHPPPPAVGAALATLMDLAVIEGRGFDLLALLTGREPDLDPLPILR